ncbi:hypothetical protein [Thalassotalea sp. ND16A]|uniref:hypothetical protein n=1 Tax=Thalassotalea sp. ND16A TaxID=1535422 RepID=UPI001269D277|nr:hypothetical protein [Thalassotalea sp. ND16A]
MFNGVCIIFLIIKMKELKLIPMREWGGVLVFLLFCTIWLIQGVDKMFYIKYLSMILVYLTIKIAASYLDAYDFVYISKKVLNIFVALISINYILSFIVANPLAREFFNFEHVNLLGSYILLSFVFVHLNSQNLESYKYQRFGLVGYSLLSTSTGALLSSLMTFVKIKAIRLSVILKATAVFILAIVVLFLILKIYSPELFRKIFSPFQMLVDGEFSNLINLAKNRMPIQDLGEQYSSSLIWRFYSYLIFWTYLIEQPIFTLLFGDGFWGFSKVWGGIAPHNDFLLILIDFGLIAFSIFMYYLIKIFIWCLKADLIILPLILMLILRFMFENNIYSYYILSGLVMNISFLYFYKQKQRYCQ